jgi:antitoxin (DNA-binding transcriptional repressor) of toxin-antitoxin stability system
MTVRKVDIAQATEPLSQYARRVDEGPLVVTADGEPIAVVVGIENVDLETVALSNHPKFLEVIERSRTRQKTEGGISSDEMRRLFESE